MPTPALTLWIDLTTGKLLSGWQSISYASAPYLKQGDSIGVELHIVKNFQGGSFAEYEFSPSTAVTLAIGRIDTAPETGTFKLNYGGNTTAELSGDATAVELQTALNALQSITAEGGVKVTKSASLFRIIWNNAVDTSNSLSFSENELYPTSTIGINLLKSGSLLLGQKQAYQLHIKQAPVANITSFVNQDAPVLSVSEIHTPSFTGDTKVWRVSISPQPRNGSFLIGFNVGQTSYTTNAIDVNASADSVLSILNAKYSGSWAVVKTGPNQWDISTTDADVFNFNSTDSGINPFSSKYGVLSLNTAEVEDLLAGELQASAMMEVQLDLNGTKQTVLQQEVVILNDLIDDASYDLVEWGSYLPADSVLRYDTEQSLTPLEKQQVKENIGIVDVDTTSLVNKDVELEGRIASLETNVLTQDEYDAINASTLPSASNTFVTQSNLTEGLSLKSDLLHEHEISSINNLDSELLGKASVTHTHQASEITDLNLSDYVTNQNYMSGFNLLQSTKADIAHTHQQFDNLNVGQFICSTSLKVESSGFTGSGFSGSEIDGIASPMTPVGITPLTLYPLEIPISIDGVVYMIPARLL